MSPRLLLCVTFSQLFLCIFSFPKPPLPQRKSSTTIWTKWEFCPSLMTVNGMSLVFSNSTPDTLKGIKLSCFESGKDNDGSRVITASAPGVSSTDDKWKLCPGGGLAVGLQQKTSENIWYGEEKRNTTVGTPMPEPWKSGTIEILLYCENNIELTQLDVFSKNTLIVPSKWKRPLLCGLGESVCAIRAQFSGPGMDKMINIQIRCCPAFQLSNNHKKTSRMQEGVVLHSFASLSRLSSITTRRVYDHHFAAELDSPYYFKWKFCNSGNYVTGMQLQFGKRGLGLLCSDMSRPKPRMPEVIQMNGDESAWEMSGDELSQQIECDGVGIGFQVKYYETSGIQVIRLICSYTKGPTDELAYVESRFRHNDEEDGTWQEPQLCGRNQAICGFKAYTHAFGEQKNLLEHIKVKCCKVPEIADVCFPRDDFELLVECDATLALAETVCTYLQSEGMSIAHSRTEGEMRDVKFHQSLGKEWIITEGENTKDSQGVSKEFTNSNKTSFGNKRTQEHWIGREQAIGEELTRANETTNAITQAVGLSQKNEQTKAESQGGESGISNAVKEGSGKNVGEGRSDTRGTSKGLGQTASKMAGSGITDEQSESLTEGVTTGSLKAKMIGASEGSTSSLTEGSSNSQTKSNSDRNTRTDSSTGGISSTLSVGGEAGYSGWGVSASVKTNFELGFTLSKTSGSEDSRESSQSSTGETNKNKMDGKSSERSSQDTSQTTEEKVQSGMKGKNTEKRRDESETVGTEETSGVTTEAKTETNVETSETLEKEASTTNLTRVNTENTVSVSVDHNREDTKSDILELKSEEKRTLLTTSNKESSVGATREFNTEETAKSTTGVTKGRSLESTSSNSEGEKNVQERSFTTGFDWKRASTSTWNLQRTTEVKMFVAPGMKSRLYQAVGHCAFYTIKTTFYKRVDSSIFGTNRELQHQKVWKL